MPPKYEAPRSVLGTLVKMVTPAMWRSKQAGSWGSPASLIYFISFKLVRERSCLKKKIRWTALVEREGSAG